MEIVFVTGNGYKFKAAEEILGRYGITPLQEKAESIEIQNPDVGRVAEFAALHASRQLQKPVIKVDCGLFITYLKGFPGVYTSDINKMIGWKGILKLMEGIEDRSASWKDALAFATPDGFTKVFFSETPFEITTEPRGESGWPLDRVLKPAKAHKTFAEMGRDERLQHWKTTIFDQLGDWLNHEYQRD